MNILLSNVAAVLVPTFDLKADFHGKKNKKWIYI